MLKKTAFEYHLKGVQTLFYFCACVGKLDAFVLVFSRSDFTFSFWKNGFFVLRIIEKEGEITHPYFILDRNPLGKNPFFRKAALEIIQKMPKWKPGLKDGKVVRSYYTIPIMFKLK